MAGKAIHLNQKNTYPAVEIRECVDGCEMRKLSVARDRLECNSIAHTYSIVAFDPRAHEMGVAVQSHYFSVGAVVNWAEAGVGVVATQAMCNKSFGPRGLKLLRRGLTARKVVEKLVQSDKGKEYRQLAVLDAKGRLAAYTGKSCISAAGHIVGKTCSVQANMMLNKKVWPAMLRSFEKTRAPLAERMLAALEAAQSKGGDIRGSQSAAILVVRSMSSGKAWEDRLIDIRVDDNQEPLVELRRLLGVHRAYEHISLGDLAIEKGDMRHYLKHISAAEKLCPDNEEIRFWHAVTLADKGMVKEALPLFREVFRKNDNWKELLRRLAPLGLNIDDKRLKGVLRQ